MNNSNNNMCMMESIPTFFDPLSSDDVGDYDQQMMMMNNNKDMMFENNNNNIHCGMPVVNNINDSVLRVSLYGQQPQQQQQQQSSNNSGTASLPLPVANAGMGGSAQTRKDLKESLASILDEFSVLDEDDDLWNPVPVITNNNNNNNNTMSQQQQVPNSPFNFQPQQQQQESSFSDAAMMQQQHQQQQQQHQFNNNNFHQQQQQMQQMGMNSECGSSSSRSFATCNTNMNMNNNMSGMNSMNMNNMNRQMLMQRQMQMRMNMMSRNGNMCGGMGGMNNMNMMNMNMMNNNMNMNMMGGMNMMNNNNNMNRQKMMMQMQMNMQMNMMNNGNGNNNAAMFMQQQQMMQQWKQAQQKNKSSLPSAAGMQPQSLTSILQSQPAACFLPKLPPMDKIYKQQESQQENVQTSSSEPFIPSSPISKNSKSFFKLHRACLNPKVSSFEVDQLLRRNPQAAGTSCPSLKVSRKTINPLTREIVTKQVSAPYTYPLHLAIHNRASQKVLGMLLQAAPSVLLIRDGPNLETPLMILLKQQPNVDIKLVDKILLLKPKCVFLKDRRDQTCLHIACYRGVENMDILKHLCGLFPQALKMINVQGRTPFQLVMAQTANFKQSEKIAAFLYQLQQEHEQTLEAERKRLRQEKEAAEQAAKEEAAAAAKEESTTTETSTSAEEQEKSDDSAEEVTATASSESSEDKAEEKVTVESAASPP